MRNQKRSFVVEHKYARRRSIKQAKSIWGETDFASLTSDAAKDAEELFAPVHESTVDKNVAQARVQVEEVKVQQVDETVERLEDISTADLARVFHAAEDRPATGRRQRLPGAMRSAVQHEAGKTSSGVSRMATDGELSADDLAILVEENKRLLMLLQKKLKDENQTLRKLIARFQ